MSTELPKQFDPKQIEPEIDKLWNENNLFHAESTDPGEPYAIVIPPPNVTAALHLGHALNNTLQDILIRHHRMKGDNTVWIPGTDHAGIATQTVVEKRVLAEQGKRRTDFKREDFVAKIQAWKDEYEARITHQLKMMGCSCDWQRQAFTMDEPRAKAVREAFFQLFKDGLIYRGKRLVNWDPATQTALADDEVEMEEVDGHFYYLRYPLESSSPSPGTPSSPSPGTPGEGRGEGDLKYVTVATTRPETMLGDTAIALNPKDPRAASLRGKSVRLPIVNRIIPIIEDDYVVLPDANSEDPKAKFATGFLKVTPAHDPNDYDIGQRHKLPMINVLAPDGSISDQHGWPREDFDQGDAGFLLGLDRFEARKAVVEWFRKNNLLEDVKPYRHTVGHSYRSHVPIEPYLSDQWYCKVTDPRLAQAALRAMAPDQHDERSSSSSPLPPGEGQGEGASENQLRDPRGSTPHTPSPQPSPEGRGSKNWEGGLSFFPARYAKTFQSWHENIRDWCISRQLWWGHRIPVWYLFWDGPIATMPSDSQIVNLEIPSLTKEEHRHVVTQVVRERKDGRIQFAICVEPGHPEIEQKLTARGAIQDPDVLDTWFSSALWPMSTLGWPDQTPELNKWNPTHTLSTARDILTLWVGRMVMFNLYFLDRLPFTEVCIHSMIQDGEGRKMSKSLNNGVDPLDIIQSHGADAMRFTLAMMATNTQDVRMPVEKDPTSGKNTSPKFDIGRNFCNKLWNATRFALTNLEGISPSPGTPAFGSEAQARRGESGSEGDLANRWILSRLARTIEDIQAALDDYRFDTYAKACYDFFWGDFCDWYIEMIKPAMRDASRAAQTADVLAHVLDASLRLMHPMIPFVTEMLFQRLNEIRPQRTLPVSKHLIRASWPTLDASLKNDQAETSFNALRDLIIEIRRIRNEYKVDQKKKVIVSISAPSDKLDLLRENQSTIELLATATIAAIDANLQSPPDAARGLAQDCEIFIEGLVDKSADAARHAKRRDELTKQISTLRGRLSNESYISKAPPHLVEQTKAQLAEAETELAKLG